jgi:hydrogenase maturation protease
MPDAPRRTIVIGIGNPDRGDDAAGRAVIRRLRTVELPAGVEIAELGGETTSLLALLERADGAVLVDACVSHLSPGTIHRFDVTAAPLPQAAFSLSTHGLGLAEAIELARALGQLPSPCVVYAIEAESVAPGEPLSPRVAAASRTVSERICGELAAGDKQHA